MNKQKTSKGLHIGLWVVQGILAFAFLFAGFTKLATPIEDMAQDGMSFVNHVSSGVVRFIGLAEMLGALGLILPAALRIRPSLTAYAAGGLAIIMASATIYHLIQGEMFMHTAILFLLTAFVSWGRLKKAPIQPK